MKEITDLKECNDEFCKCGKVFFNIEKATPQERIDHKLDDFPIPAMPLRRSLETIEAEQTRMNAIFEEKMALFDARLKDIEEILSNLTLTLQNHLR